MAPSTTSKMSHSKVVFLLLLNDETKRVPPQEECCIESQSRSSHSSVLQSFTTALVKVHPDILIEKGIADVY